jgi:hypothetical protein
MTRPTAAAPFRQQPSPDRACAVYGWWKLLAVPTTHDGDAGAHVWLGRVGSVI